MDLKAEIERIVGLLHGCVHSRGWDWYNRCGPCITALDLWQMLRPKQPDREALYTILEKHNCKNGPGMTCACYGHGRKAWGVCSSLCENLMVWAAGKSEPPVWCEHCDLEIATCKTTEQYLSNKWKFCPICGKPRPGGVA